MTERYAASRGDAGLLKLMPPDEPARLLSPRRAPITEPPPASPASAKDQDPMAVKKKPKRYSPEEKAAIMVRIAESSAAQVSRETGITEGTLSNWKKAKPKAAKKVAKRAASTNGNGHGHATPDGLPTLELKGLRGWVARAVRDELAPVRRQLQNLVDAMGKAP